MATSSVYVLLLLIAATVTDAARINRNGRAKKTNVENTTTTVENNTTVQGCVYMCDAYLQTMGVETACALGECSSCSYCTGGGSKPTPPSANGGNGGGGGGCGALYREAQVGLKCGKHAVNAVLQNSGLATTDEAELDNWAQMLGSPSNGDDYDMAPLTFVLMNRFGDGATQSVGEIGAPARRIEDLIAEVGTIQDIENTPEHQREALLRQQFTLDFDDLDWVVCNVGGHWKTYFKDQGTGDFCNLDSIPARSGRPAARLSEDDLKNTRCRGIIVPTGQ